MQGFYGIKAASGRIFCSSRNLGRKIFRRERSREEEQQKRGGGEGQKGKERCREEKMSSKEVELGVLTNY